MPLISVIIPVYNGETTIKETIDSVLKQTFKDFELIVINDGSKDTTVEIVEGVQDSRLKLFSYSNAGQATSRNRGLSHAVGEFIAFLDADDLWTPDKLETQLKALQANPQAAVAYSWTNFIDESGKFLRQGSYVSVTGDVYKNLLVVNFLENGSNPLVRKQALAEVGEFDESLPPAEDWDMWLRLAARYPFVAVPSPQILYRQSSSSMSSKIDLLASECLKVIERGYARAPESIQYLKKQSLTNIYKYLTFKALEGQPDKHRGLTAARFFWQVIINDPELLRKRFTWKMLLKILLWVFLPPQRVQRLMKTRLYNLPNIHTTILRHVQVDPF